MPSPLDPPAYATLLPLPGLEADNLLAFLALLGLLRALEAARPEWRARVSWGGTPVQAALHLTADAAKIDVAQAAGEGIERTIEAFDFGDRKNVDFERVEYRKFATDMR